MTALCLQQPWAELVACGRKTIETRTWNTPYRGSLLIVASKKPDERALDVFPDVGSWPRGEAIAIAKVVNVRPMTEEDEDAACCGWYPGAFAWELEEVERIRFPFKVKGRLGLFDVELPTARAKKKRRRIAVNRPRGLGELIG